MVINKSLLTVALLALGLTAHAVPAKPGLKKQVTLANGTTLELTLQGDEHYSYLTDGHRQAYELHEGRLMPLSLDEATAKWASRRSARIAGPGSTRAAGAARIGTSSNATTGKHRGLVILMQFADVSFVTPNPREVYNRFFNEAGYKEGGMTGSVRDYFLQQSYGQLDIEFDVVGPYTTNSKMAYYGAHDGDSNDSRPELMVAEAVDKASAEVDYSNYDWDGDGEVDQVFVIYAGYNEAQGADENTIWPHEYKLAYGGVMRTYNGVRVNTYGCSSELSGSGKGDTNPTIDGVGTACHEFSHCLGLPDMYDTSGDNYGMAYWDVMCAGSYNNNSRTPAGYTSYERWFAGWMTPTEVSTMTRISGMKPLATDQEAYVLYNEANRNEYYLLENRQREGFDAGLPGHGLLVVHVDYDERTWAGNVVNNMADRQRMTIVAADNNYLMTYTGMAGDAWPGTSGNTALTNYTTPAATLYTENSDGRKLMSKPIDNITESDDGLISFVACRPELGVPVAETFSETEGTASFTATWAAVSGAVGYEVQVTEIGTAAATPEEALEREFDFSGMESKSTGYSDVSGKLPQYGLSGWAGSKLYTSPNKMKIGTSTSVGYVRTAVWNVPQSSEMTVVMGADVVKAGTAVKGLIRLAYGNQGEAAQYETADFEVKGNGRQVFQFEVRKDRFYLEIRPEAQMYLNYLAIYDGYWNAEQLGIETAAGARTRSVARASKVSSYSTDTNSLTLTDLNTSSRFIYKVRAKGEENTYSQWSDERTFQFSGSAGIGSIRTDGPANTRVYDLRGRQVAQPSKGIYIKDGRKMVKK